MSEFKNKGQKMRKLGDLGEIEVVKCLRGLSHLVTESTNQFDSVKDITVDGVKGEVKTQVPFFKRDAFTAKEDQIEKMSNAKFNYFVCVGCKQYDKYAWRIYEMASKDFDWENQETYKTKDGRTMYLFPRSHPAMKIIGMVEEDSIRQEMLNCSISGLNNG